MTFLTLDDVLIIHSDQISRYGGSGGIRDIGLLDSALSVVHAQFEGQFTHESIYQMAAAYLYHIAQNHPFVDGNKRTAVAAALIFLDLNGVEVRVDEQALADFVLDVARGLVEKKEIAGFLREASSQ